MRVAGVPYRAIFTEGDGTEVRVIDQTVLPHRFETVRLETTAHAARAIRDMVVRGAPLIGATAAYGVALAMRADPSDGALDRAIAQLGATRPTAVNLRWALDAAGTLLRGLPPGERTAAAYDFAARLCEDDVRTNRSIGEFGLGIFREIARRAGGGGGGGGDRALNVMTHCNAGWLATVDWGPRPHPSTSPTTGASPSTCGSARPGRDFRARGSPRGNSASMACRTRWSPTARPDTCSAAARSTS